MRSGVQIVLRLRLSRILLPSPCVPLPEGEGHRVRGFVLRFRSLKGFCNSLACPTAPAEILPHSAYP